MGYDGDTDGIFDRDIDWSAQISAIKEDNPDIEAVKKSRNPEYKGFFGPNVLKLCKEAEIVLDENSEISYEQFKQMMMNEL